MPRVALATAGHVPDLMGDGALLIGALAALGVEAEIAVWDAVVDWSAYAGVLIRSTWDYTERPAEFVAWAERVAGVTRLANPAGIVRWNSDKRYLEDLRAAGVEVVPTTWLSPDDEVTLPDWPGWVVKPAVSAAARDSAYHGDVVAARAHVRVLYSAGRVAMVQPYLEAVDTEGETGLFVFGGVPSHAVRKNGVLSLDVPPSAGYELAEKQEVRAVPIDARLADFAGRVLAAVPEPVLYARVDTVPGADGRPLLLELEVIEPHFFLALAPEGADAFARAAADWLRD